MNEVCNLTALYIFYIFFSYYNHINFAKCDDISVILRVFCDSVSVIKKQEMSQSRDECPQRNWSSIRHIRGKLAVI